MSKKSKKKKPFKYDPQWAKAKELCRLNMEDIRMAKELGINPRSLMKNRPSKSQQWKLPVKFWIREQYDKMLERREANQAHKKATQAGLSRAPQQAASEEEAAAAPNRHELGPDASCLVGDLMDEPPARVSEPVSTASAEHSLDDIPF